MKAKTKSNLIKGGMALVLIILLLKCCSGPDVREEDARKQAEQTNAEITAMLEEPYQDQQLVEQSLYITDDTYNPEGLKKSLQDSLAVIKSLQEEGARLDRFLDEKSKEAQPENVVEQCKKNLDRLNGINAKISETCAQALDLYAAQYAGWNKDVQENSGLASLCATMEGHCSRLAQRREALQEEWQSNLDNGYKVAAGLDAASDADIEGFLTYWEKQKEDLQETYRAMEVLRAPLLDTNSPIYKELASLKSQIEEAGTCKFDTSETRLPQVKAPEPPAPEPEEEVDTPPAPEPEVYQPDLCLAATGDLADTLLCPIVCAWIADADDPNALGLSGEIKQEIDDAGNIRISVPAPDMSGLNKPGVLQILVQTPEDGKVFPGLIAQEYDLLLTGRVMGAEEEQEWRAGVLDNPARIEIYHRARVASDAMVFFRNPNGDLPQDVSEAELWRLPKVFSPDDAARKEAACVFGLTQGAEDSAAPAGKLLPSIIEAFPSKVVLGVYHRDRNSLPKAQLVLRDDQRILATSIPLDGIPSKYRKGMPEKLRFLPTDFTINSGEYPFTYRINFFRGKDSVHQKDIAVKLMTYAATRGGKAQEIVRAHGFTPLRLSLMPPSGHRPVLDNSDLPVKELIRKLQAPSIATHNDFGYSEKDSYVYGIKLPYSIYYDTGSSRPKSEDELQAEGGLISRENIDPESFSALGDVVDFVNEIATKEPVALVLVGHADCTYNGTLQLSEASYDYNNRLSGARADAAYQAFFVSSLNCLKYPAFCNVSLSCSWTRPCRNIRVDLPKEAQLQNLAACRRVEIFLIFPNSRKSEGKGN